MAWVSTKFYQYTYVIDSSWGNKNYMKNKCFANSNIYTSIFLLVSKNLVSIKPNSRRKGVWFSFRSAQFSSAYMQLEVSCEFHIFGPYLQFTWWFLNPFVYHIFFCYRTLSESTYAFRICICLRLYSSLYTKYSRD